MLYFTTVLEAQGAWIANPTADQATEMYHKLDLTSILPNKTPKGRARRDQGQKKWTTIARALFIKK
jgi:hypothetical protein